MKRRLLVSSLVVAASAALAACGGGRSVGTTEQSIISAPVELEVGNVSDTDTSAAPDELLDSTFGCGAPGHIEYGLIPTPSSN